MWRSISQVLRNKGSLNRSRWQPLTQLPLRWTSSYLNPRKVEPSELMWDGTDQGPNDSVLLTQMELANKPLILADKKTWKRIYRPHLDAESKRKRSLLLSEWNGQRHTQHRLSYVKLKGGNTSRMLANSVLCQADSNQLFCWLRSMVYDQSAYAPITVLNHLYNLHCIDFIRHHTLDRSHCPVGSSSSSISSSSESSSSSTRIKGDILINSGPLQRVNVDHVQSALQCFSILRDLYLSRNHHINPRDNHNDDYKNDDDNNNNHKDSWVRNKEMNQSDIDGVSRAAILLEMYQSEFEWLTHSVLVQSDDQQATLDIINQRLSELVFAMGEAYSVISEASILQRRSIRPHHRPAEERSMMPHTVCNSNNNEDKLGGYENDEDLIKVKYQLHKGLVNYILRYGHINDAIKPLEESLQKLIENDQRFQMNEQQICEIKLSKWMSKCASILNDDDNDCDSSINECSKQESMTTTMKDILVRELINDIGIDQFSQANCTLQICSAVMLSDFLLKSKNTNHSEIEPFIASAACSMTSDSPWISNDPSMVLDNTLKLLCFNFNLDPKQLQSFGKFPKESKSSSSKSTKKKSNDYNISSDHITLKYPTTSQSNKFNRYSQLLSDLRELNDFNKGQKQKNTVILRLKSLHCLQQFIDDNGGFLYQTKQSSSSSLTNPLIHSYHPKWQQIRISLLRELSKNRVFSIIEWNRKNNGSVINEHAMLDYEACRKDPFRKPIDDGNFVCKEDRNRHSPITNQVAFNVKTEKLMTQDMLAFLFSLVHSTMRYNCLDLNALPLNSLGDFDDDINNHTNPSIQQQFDRKSQLRQKRREIAKLKKEQNNNDDKNENDESQWYRIRLSDIYTDIDDIPHSLIQHLIPSEGIRYDDSLGMHKNWNNIRRQWLNQQSIIGLHIDARYQHFIRRLLNDEMFHRFSIGYPFFNDERCEEVGPLITQITRDQSSHANAADKATHHVRFLLGKPEIKPTLRDIDQRLCTLQSVIGEGPLMIANKDHHPRQKANQTSRVIRDLLMTDDSSSSSFDTNKNQSIENNEEWKDTMTSSKLSEIIFSDECRLNWHRCVKAFEREFDPEEVVSALFVDTDVLRGTVAEDSPFRVPINDDSSSIRPPGSKPHIWKAMPMNGDHHQSGDEEETLTNDDELYNDEDEYSTFVPPIVIDFSRTTAAENDFLLRYLIAFRRDDLIQQFCDVNSQIRVRLWIPSMRNHDILANHLGHVWMPRIKVTTHRSVPEITKLRMSDMHTLFKKFRDPNYAMIWPDCVIPNFV